MSSIFCPHGRARWEPSVAQAVTQPSGYNVLQLLDIQEETQKAQQGILSMMVIGLMFNTPIPDRDEDNHPLAMFHHVNMPEILAIALRAGENNLEDLDFEETKMEAIEGPGIQAKDVQEVFEYLKSHPSEHDKLFYQCQQIHRIWQNRGAQCGECWAEKEKFEKLIVTVLGKAVPWEVEKWDD